MIGSAAGSVDNHDASVCANFRLGAPDFFLFSGRKDMKNSVLSMISHRAKNLPYQGIFTN